MMQVTDDIGLAYDFAKTRASAAFTAEELAVGAKIKLAGAQRVAMLLTELRIFDCIGSYRPRHYCLMVPPLGENAARIAEIEKVLRTIILPKLRKTAQQAQSIVASEPSAYPEYQPKSERRARPRHEDDNEEPPTAGSQGQPENPPPAPDGHANQNQTDPAPQKASDGARNEEGKPEQPATSSAAGYVVSDLVPRNDLVDGAGPASVREEPSMLEGPAPDMLGPSKLALELRRIGSPISRSDKVRVLFDMIRRPEGATLEELADALGNQPHSVRATISVKSREHGLKVECVSGRYFLRTA